MPHVKPITCNFQRSVNTESLDFLGAKWEEVPILLNVFPKVRLSTRNS